jgi:hypothetical protein
LPLLPGTAVWHSFLPLRLAQLPGAAAWHIFLVLLPGTSSRCCYLAQLLGAAVWHNLSEAKNFWSFG